MRLKQYLNESDQLEMQLAEPNTPIAQTFNGQEKLVKKIGNIERYKGQFGSFRYILRDKGVIIASVQGVLKDRHGKNKPILSNIFVADGYRRTGIASKLFAQAKKDIKGLKVSTDKTELGKKFFNEEIIIRDGQKEIDVLKWVFNKKNVNKIAHDYDAVVQSMDTSSATLKDNRGRLLFLDKVSKRYLNKLKEVK